MMQQLMPRILCFPSLSKHICNINHLMLLDFQISRHPDFKHYPILRSYIISLSRQNFCMPAYVIDINGIYTEVVCNIRRLIGKYQNARINTPSFICQTQDKTGIEDPDYD